MGERSFVEKRVRIRWPTGCWWQGRKELQWLQVVQVGERRNKVWKRRGGLVINILCLGHVLFKWRCLMSNWKCRSWAQCRWKFGDDTDAAEGWVWMTKSMWSKQSTRESISGICEVQMASQPRGVWETKSRKMIREEWKEQINGKGRLHAGPCSNSHGKSPLPPDFPVSCLRAQGVHRVYHSVVASCLASAASQVHPEAQAPLGLLSSCHSLFWERGHSACLHLHSLLDQKPISGVLAGTEKERGRVSRPNQEESQGPSAPWRIQSSLTLSDLRSQLVIGQRGREAQGN